MMSRLSRYELQKFASLKLEHLSCPPRHFAQEQTRHFINFSRAEKSQAQFFHRMNNENIHGGSSNMLATSNPPTVSNHATFQTFSQGAYCQSFTGPSHSGGHNSKPDPPTRKWLNIWPNRKNQKPLKGMEFTLMTYNVLSQLLLERHRDLYISCVESELEWEKRSVALLSQILHHKADIICLQEVEEEHWFKCFKPCLERSGYQGVYKKRTQQNSDGCAIVFKSSKFSLIKSIPVEFYRGGILDRGNIGVIVLLHPNQSVYKGHIEKICVTTTHLLFNPKRGDIKLAQLILLLAEMDKHASYCPVQDPIHVDMEKDTKAKTASVEGKAHPYCPTILCGDLNLEPFSKLYHFITRGHLTYENLVSRLLSGQSEGGYYGGNNLVPRDLVPSWLYITEKCQYSRKLFESDDEKDKINKDNVDKSSDNPPAMPSPIKAPGILQYMRSPDSQGQINSQTIQSANVICSNQSGHQEDGDLSSHIVTDDSEISKMGGHDNEKARAVKDQDLFNTGTVYHNFKFKSVYQHEFRLKKKKFTEVTTQHARASCTLDYIFYSSGKFSVVENEKVIPEHCRDKSHQHDREDGHHSTPSKKWKEGIKISEKDGDISKHGHKVQRRQMKGNELSGNGCNETPGKTVDGNKDLEFDNVLVYPSAEASGHSHYTKLSDGKVIPHQATGSISSAKEDRSLNYEDHRLLKEYKANKTRPIVFENNLQLVAKYSLLTREDFNKAGCLPTSVFPSDHLCLISKFILY